MAEGESEEFGLIFGGHLGGGCGYGKTESVIFAEELRKYVACAGGGEAVGLEEANLQGIKYERWRADHELVDAGLFDFHDS